MRQIAILSCLLACALAHGRVQAQALLNNPNGMMGYRWGMSQQAAEKVQALSLTCRAEGELSVCAGSGPAPAKEGPRTVLPGAGGTFALQYAKGRLIGLIHTFSTPAPIEVLAMLHNLLGPPAHRIQTPRLPDSKAAQAITWIRPRTVVELIVDEADNAEVPNVRLTLRAYSRSQYLQHHNVLPLLTH